VSGLDLVVAFAAGVCVGLLAGLLAQPTPTPAGPDRKEE
jgi:hypothetical protein